jgi:hypothetical protein
MTAPAGDALSHGYFSQPPTQFSKPISKPIFSKAIFKARLSGTDSRRICRRDLAAGTRARMARQLQAQSFLPDLHNGHDPDRGNRIRLFLPFTCRQFVNTNEHFIHK